MTLKTFKTFCVICRRRIPAKRHRRRAATCSMAHQKRLTKLRKLERDSRKCSHCSRPVTPEQMTEFRLWRRDHPHGSTPGRKKAAKGFRAPAKAIHPMADFAYVVTEGRKKAKEKRRPNR